MLLLKFKVEIRYLFVTRYKYVGCNIQKYKEININIL